MYRHFGPETLRTLDISAPVSNCPLDISALVEEVSRHFGTDGSEVSGHIGTEMLQILTADTVVYKVVFQS